MDTRQAPFVQQIQNQMEMEIMQLQRRKQTANTAARTPRTIAENERGLRRPLAASLLAASRLRTHPFHPNAIPPHSLRWVGSPARPYIGHRHAPRSTQGWHEPHYCGSGRPLNLMWFEAQCPARRYQRKVNRNLQICYLHSLNGQRAAEHASTHRFLLTLPRL
jgi:hypothetical protein